MRSGYITKLWRNGFDINKIRQAIGHKSIGITQGYIEDMDEAELQMELSTLEEKKKD
jgi:site-specific recombinase XerD